MYRLEHDRIALLAEEYLERVQKVANHPLPDERRAAARVLMLLDAAHALRHVLEHHHEREHMALAQELPWTCRKPPGLAWTARTHRLHNSRPGCPEGDGPAGRAAYHRGHDFRCPHYKEPMPWQTLSPHWSSKNTKARRTQRFQATAALRPARR